ncbi:protein phosphatase 2C domain-containing protein [Cohnella yongneupensis]|uniref:Protein phosphatase 2C domain-containing protein n=1 Tax=Cohnella yongneupensis TaxID=425006 RepID=A0ABW0R4B8_9BACL
MWVRRGVRSSKNSFAVGILIAVLCVCVLLLACAGRAEAESKLPFLKSIAGETPASSASVEPKESESPVPAESGTPETANDPNAEPKAAADEDGKANWTKPVWIGGIAVACAAVGFIAGALVARKRRGRASLGKNKPEHSPANELTESPMQTAVSSGMVSGTGFAAKVVPGNAQHIGARQEQQDAFAFSDFDDESQVRLTGFYAVLADGMGGLAKGRETSNLAVGTMLRQYGERKASESIPEALLRGVRLANEAVCRLARDSDMEWNIGTTLMTAVIQEGKLYWISVGDSRIYLARQGNVTQLTTDHVYGRKLQEDVRNGIISREQAESHPERATLTSYLGIPEVQEIDKNLTPYPLQHGDCVMLCSDGLHGAITESEMSRCFTEGGHPQQIAESLVQAALAKGIANQDNVTVAILAYR